MSDAPLGIDDLPAGPPPAVHPLPIHFTGSGSEYFRIWSVNLLLSIVTLGIYFPWAKVRRLRYFYGSTRIGGDALDFHGTPSRMLRGYLLVGVLFDLYSFAGKISPAAGLAAFAIVAAIGPALFRAGMRFRLANTSWRGLRFGFDGDLAGAYRTLLPLVVPGLAGALAALAGSGQPVAPDRVALISVVSTVPTLLLLPLFWWLLKRYQHGHYVFGQERTTLRVGLAPFYGLFARIAAMSLGVGILAGLVAAVVASGSLIPLLQGRARDPWAIASAVVGIAVALLVFYLAAVATVRPYAAARLQNLVWNHTASANLSFSSSLRVRTLVLLTLKNWLLTLATLGFYAPFAAIALARLRVEAMTVHSRIDPAELEARAIAGADDAAGDAAGELFGIDIGL